MISLKNKFIYTHVTKCGGTSILSRLLYHDKVLEDKLGWGWQDHSYFSESKQVIIDNGYDLDEFYKFTIIRNTYHRLASLYKHIITRERVWRAWFVPNKITDFRKFILEIEMIMDYFDSNESVRGTETLFTWLSTNGQFEFDDIILLPELDEKWEYICSRISIPYRPLIHKRVRNKTLSYSSLYTEEMINKVNLVYGDEIEHFKFILDEV